jgi:hypothetical protein
MPEERDFYEQPRQAEQPAAPVTSEVVELYNLEDYRGHVETHHWTPDKSKPRATVRLDLKVQILKGSDRNLIQRKVNEVNMRPAQIAFETEQLGRLKPPREIERLEKQLREVSKFDAEFAGDEDKAEARRTELQKRIDELNSEYREQYRAIESKIQGLISAPNFYQTLRTELFCKVIADHTIGWPLNGVLTKIDFNSESPDHELPDEFAGALMDFIFDVLQRGKAKSRNGSRK